MVRFVSNIEVRQNHQTRLINLNDIERLPGSKPIDNWLRLDATNSFIDIICDKEGLSRDQVFQTRRGRNGGTWAHPLLAVDYVMWFSPEFKYEALKWVYDGLCDLRNAAGDSFKEMCQTIEEVLAPPAYEAGKVYASEAWMIQSIAGIKTGQRNIASVDQLNDLAFLEKANTELLRCGIRDRSKRRDELKRLLRFRKL